MKGIKTYIKESGHRFKDLSGYFKRMIQLKRLEKHVPVIDMVLTEYDRKSCDETMMIKSYRKSFQETTNRKTHMENQACLAVEIARKLGLNEKVVSVMAKHHDIGHTFLGHSGEWWISNIKEDYGIGYYTHNALGARELVYSKDIYSEIVDKMKTIDPNVSKKEIDTVRKSLWLIIDAINSHNGENADKQSIPNFKKTETEFEQEILYCHTKKKFDRGIEPATTEASLMKICDKISYIPSDMVDGIREGFIDGLDEEYIEILTAIGITEEEIDLASKSDNYDPIARRLKDIFAEDLTKNSTKRRIKMSDEMTTLMYKLLDKNNREIVNYVLMEEDINTYPAAIRGLMDKYSEEILDRDIIEKIKTGDLGGIEEEIKSSKGTMKNGFWKHIYQMKGKDLEFTTKMIEEATKQSISDELQVAQNVVMGNVRYNPDPEFENKNERIKRYISYYENRLKKGNYTDQDKEDDITKLYSNIEAGKLSSLHVGMDKRIALEIASQYIATLSDSEFMQLLKEEKMITDEEHESLTRKYKDIDIRAESKMQSSWVSIQQLHKDAAENEVSK